MTSNSGCSPKRGEIWLVDLDPTLGEEMRKTRPVVVISSDDLNTGLELKVTVPVTGWKEVFENHGWFAKLAPSKGNGLAKTSAVNGLQIRCLSMKRFKSRLGRTSVEEFADIMASVAIVLEIS